MAGVLDTGVVIKTVQEILDEINTDTTALFGPTANTSTSSVIGQYNGIVADVAADLWDFGAAVASAFEPGSASGAALDNVLDLTGGQRIAAQKSTVEMTLNIDDTITVPAGSIISVGAEGAQFATTADVENTSGSTDDFLVEAKSVEYGAIEGAAGTITNIVTPISGWNSATNALDATLGNAEETDAAARLRREKLLRTASSGPVDAIITAVSEVAGVTDLRVWENEKDATDERGLQTH